MFICAYVCSYSMKERFCVRTQRAMLQKLVFRCQNDVKNYSLT